MKKLIIMAVSLLLWVFKATCLPLEAPRFLRDDFFVDFEAIVKEGYRAPSKVYSYGYIYYDCNSDISSTTEIDEIRFFTHKGNHYRLEYWNNQRAIQQSNNSVTTIISHVIAVYENDRFLKAARSEFNNGQIMGKLSLSLIDQKLRVLRIQDGVTEKKDIILPNEFFIFGTNVLPSLLLEKKEITGCYYDTEQDVVVVVPCVRGEHPREIICDFRSLNGLKAIYRYDEDWINQKTVFPGIGEQIRTASLVEVQKERERVLAVVSFPKIPTKGFFKSSKPYSRIRVMAHYPKSVEGILMLSPISRTVIIKAKSECLELETSLKNTSNDIANEAYIKEHRLLASNSSIQSSHPDIIKAADEAVAPSSYGHFIADMLLSWVYTQISYNTDTLDGSALDTLRKGTGDCTEISNLYSALLRARGIPAEPVAGYVYDKGCFYGHNWVRLFVDGEWIEADPTIGTFIESAVYIEDPVHYIRPDYIEIISDTRIPKNE